MVLYECKSKGFPRFTVTDEQRIEATPKRKASGSNPLGRTIFAANIAVCGVFCVKSLMSVLLSPQSILANYRIGTGK